MQIFHQITITDQYRDLSSRPQGAQQIKNIGCKSLFTSGRNTDSLWEGKVTGAA